MNGLFIVSLKLKKQRQPFEIKNLQGCFTEIVIALNGPMKIVGALFKVFCYQCAMPHAGENLGFCFRTLSSAVQFHFVLVKLIGQVKTKFIQLVIIIGEIQRQLGFGKRIRLFIIDSQCLMQHVNGFFKILLRPGDRFPQYCAVDAFNWCGD